MPAWTSPPIGQSALRRCRVSLPGHLYHVTTSTDRRQRFFDDFHSARAVIQALNGRDALADSRVVAWVLMPDHLHVVLQLGDHSGLSEVVNRIKAGTGRALNKHLNRTGPVWQRSYHDHLLRKEEDLRTVARYVVMNPLRAGLVKRLADYPHWDAMWL